jgi:hypothetical protein
VFTRRFVLLGLFVLASVASTGCCGRLRNCVYRWRHGCGGCCVPSFDAPVYGGPAVGDPGCATCYNGPGAAVPVSGPVFSAPYPAPSGIQPPTVQQTTEPPMAKPPGK